MAFEPKPIPEQRDAALGGNSSRHLNQAELARRWRMSQSTLANWRWAGCGPTYIKLNGRILYRLVDIERFENARLRVCSGKVPANTDPPVPPLNRG